LAKCVAEASEQWPELGSDAEALLAFWALMDESVVVGEGENKKISVEVPAEWMSL